MPAKPKLVSLTAGEEIDLVSSPDYFWKEGIPSLPDQMRYLPVDAGGLPVPYFVTRSGGSPQEEMLALELCHRRRVCWVCGEYLQNDKAFIVGATGLLERVSYAPPSHNACARFRAAACCFPTGPEKEKQSSSQVRAIWFARSFAVDHYVDGKIWRFTCNPKKLEWYADGKAATPQAAAVALEDAIQSLDVARANDTALLLQWQIAAARRHVARLQVALPATL